jgi:hypothetical protein
MEIYVAEHIRLAEETEQERTPAAETGIMLVKSEFPLLFHAAWPASAAGTWEPRISAGRNGGKYYGASMQAVTS